MTREEHLLKIAEEECSEIAQRFSKALRFGTNEIEPGQNKDNREQIYRELADLKSVMEMLEEERILCPFPSNIVRKWKINKKKQVEKYLDYSHECGRLTERILL